MIQDKVARIRLSFNHLIIETCVDVEILNLTLFSQSVLKVCLNTPCQYCSTLYIAETPLLYIYYYCSQLFLGLTRKKYQREAPSKIYQPWL